MIAFGSDAERLAQEFKVGLVLKISHLNWTVPDSKYTGTTSCEFEFRADKDTVITVIPDSEAPPTEPAVSMTYPEYVSYHYFAEPKLQYSATIHDLRMNKITAKEVQIRGIAFQVSFLFPGAGMTFIHYRAFR